jgi:zeaxanthin glucosyltransferase
MQGDDAFEFACRLVLDQTQTILESLPAMVQANNIDALVLDTVQFYAELGAMQLDLPYIHVSSALHFDYTGYTPLSLYGWPHQATLRRWLETGRVSKSLLNYRGGVTRASEHMRRAPD